MTELSRGRLSRWRLRRRGGTACRPGCPPRSTVNTRTPSHPYGNSLGWLAAEGLLLAPAPEPHEARRCQLPGDPGVRRGGVAPPVRCYQARVDQVESVEEAEDLGPGTEPHLSRGAVVLGCRLPRSRGEIVAAGVGDDNVA